MIFEIMACHEISLVELAKQGVLWNENLNKLKCCDNYILGYQQIVKLESDVHNSSRYFKNVHSDLCDSTRVAIHGGWFSFPFYY